MKSGLNTKLLMIAAVVCFLFRSNAGAVLHCY